MSAILKFDFQKRKKITFFWRKLSKLHKKDPILHVTTTFSLKQGETRTSCGSIPPPLRWWHLGGGVLNTKDPTGMSQCCQHEVVKFNLSTSFVHYNNKKPLSIISWKSYGEYPFTENLQNILTFKIQVTTIIWQIDYISWSTTIPDLNLRGNQDRDETETNIITLLHWERKKIQFEINKCYQLVPVSLYQNIVSQENLPDIKV